MVMIPDLLQNAAWTRRLARSLVADDALAEDVAQDVWLAISQRPPRATEPLQPWLRTVVRNRVFNLTRERRRRQAREAGVEAPEATESAEEVLGRLQLHKLLVDVVGELAEPYRKTVLLRYFDGLSSAEIGAREHLPAGTVRGRLKTALELLRVALDRRTGARKHWMVPLTDFADRPAVRGPGPRFGPAGKVIVGGSLAITVVTSLLVLVARPKPPERAFVARTEDVRAVPAAPQSAGDDAASVSRGSALPPAHSFAPAPVGVEDGASARTGAGVGLHPLTGVVTVRQPVPARLIGRVQDGRVAGVVVRIVKGLPDSLPVPSGEVQLAFRTSTLGPRVQVGRIGQSIVVENTDSVAHALRVRQAQVTLFDQTIASGARSPAIAIPKALDAIRLEGLDDPPTVASVMPAGNPFHAVTAEEGRFVLNDLPPGVYTLQAEDEILGTRSVEITIPAALPSIVFAFDGEAPRVPRLSCTIATIGRGPVGRACEAGGRVEAKRLMKSLVKRANASGPRLTCDGCHQNLDDYTLLEGARAKLDKLTAPSSR